MGKETVEDRAIAGLYRAAVHPEDWHRALLAVTDLVGAEMFHFLGIDTRKNTPEFNLISTPDLMAPLQSYSDYYQSVDPRLHLVQQLQIGTVMACQDHFSDAFVEHSEFYQDYLIPTGMRYVIRARTYRSATRDVLLGLFRSPGKAFSAAEIHQVERLVAHLCNACDLWAHATELATKASIGEQLHEDSACVLIGLDGCGHVVHQNAAAVAMLGDRDCLELHHGHLRACHPDDAVLLRSTIQRAMHAGVASTLSISGLRTGPHACFLRIARLYRAKVGGMDAGLATVVVTGRLKEEKRRLSAEVLRQLFGLTKSESAVAIALIEGLTPEEYAQKTNRSMPTVRTQLRAIYSKTQTRRQGETVKLLSRIPPG